MRDRFRAAGKMPIRATPMAMASILGPSAGG
jgi:hypothetical protein